MNGEVENIKQGIMYSLEKRGVLENLRAYLRTDLYNKLKQSDEVPVNLNLNKSAKFNYKDRDFSQIKLNKLSLSFIADYMKKNSLNYSLSVFLSECKTLIGDELYSESEISQVCPISFEELEKSEEVSFLNYFIKGTILKNNAKNKKTNSFLDAETQTDQADNHTISMEDRLKEIDNKYSKGINLEALMPAKAIEEKVLKIQKELEARFKADLEREVQRLKEVEISQMRIEENRKYMRKIEEVREEYEKDHREKLEALKKRESDVTMRISYKEKELESQLYENRQKFLSELDLLKRKEEEFKRKYDNDYNNLKLEEEKYKFKQKELDYLKDTSTKKIKEEIEQFKLEYDRLFEGEKNEMKKKRQEIEEKEFKNSLFEERLSNTESANKLMLKEKSELKEEMSSMERSISSLKKDNEMLREELKILAMNEKRNIEMLSKSEIEIQHLREENRLLRESVDDQKKLTEERRRDQGILIDNLKKQLNENHDRFEKNKEQYESDNERLKKYYLGYIEREKETYEEKRKELERKIKSLEEQCKKYRDLYNQMSKRAAESNFNINTQSQGSLNIKSDYYGTMKLNNYFNNLNDIKATDRLLNWSKLEKEADDIKHELKRSFAVSSRRDDRVNMVTSQQIDKVYNDIYDKIYSEKLNQIKTLDNNFMQSNSNNKCENTNTNQNSNLNKYKTITSIDNPEQPKDSANETNKETNKDLAVKNEIKITNTEAMDEKVHSVRSDQNILNTIKNDIDSKREEPADIKFTQNINSFKNNSNSIEKKDLENESKVKIEIGKDDGRAKIEEELNKMKAEYNQKLQNEKMPTPVIISGTNAANNNSVRSTQRDFDNKQESNQDFSIGNITSSNEWDLETNRKDTNRLSGNRNVNNLNNLSNLHSSNIINTPSKQDKKEPTVILLNKKEDTHNTQNKKAVPNITNNTNTNSSSPTIISNVSQKENLSKDPNACMTKSKGLNQSIKEELEESNNFSNIMENIVKESKRSYTESQAEPSRNSFNKFSNVNFEIDKNEIEEDIKADGDSENYEYDFVEDVDGLDKKMSVDLGNFGNNSLNFNNSVRNTTNNANANNTNNVSKSIYKSQSIDKNFDKLLQSKNSNTNIEENIIEDISVENSKKDKDLPNSAKSNTIEEDLKYNDYYQSNANLNVVGASSSYNNIMKNVLKDSSLKDSKLYESRTSDIKEEIIADDGEDDGYVPVDHNEDYY